MPKFVVLKSWKTLQYILKLYSNLFQTLEEASRLLRLEKPKNWQKFLKI